MTDISLPLWLAATALLSLLDLVKMPLWIKLASPLGVMIFGIVVLTTSPVLVLAPVGKPIESALLIFGCAGMVWQLVQGFRDMQKDDAPNVSAARGESLVDR